MAPSPAPGVPFQLRPFPGDPVPAGLELGGNAGRSVEGLLTLCYRLAGPLDTLHLPDLCTAPRRLDDLWRSTCLECFLALPDDPGYWEVNLSPAGHWNGYRLAGYRQDLIPEPTWEAPPAIERRRGGGSDTLAITLPLPPSLAAAETLAVGVTAVIATRRGELSYWALRHPGEQPDFHRREGFALRL